MVGDILKIKNCIPPLVANALHRPRITERLDSFLVSDEGFTRQLTLFSAPAGFGKTTVVRSWLKGKESNTAWLSLDEEDNDTERFWTYFLSALQNLDTNLGQGPLEMLHSSNLLSDPSGSFSQILTPLLNDLFILEEHSYLVLEDYHLINNAEIHNNLAFFIDNLPPTLHLVVTTRSDPPWPLSGWRVKNKMTEIRMTDLKFNEDEAASYLGMSTGPRLNEQQINTLYRKTEGWITGLQLAAFSLSANQDVEQFIESFAGSHRHVLLFLSEEVFNRQSAEVKEFLSKTSILNRFSASLCDAVTGNSDSAGIIASLEKNNLFLIPLDEEGSWFRYHPLFSDLLHHNLKKHNPGCINSLHEKAGRWFLEAGEAGEAVRHILIAKNYVEAARILHDSYGKILLSEGPILLNRCLSDIPLETLKQFPRLVAHMALFMLITKGREESIKYLELAETLEYSSEDDQQDYLGIISAVKAYFHIFNYDFSNAKTEAMRAIELLPGNNLYWRMNVAVYLGDTALFSGDPGSAYSYYLEAHLSNQKAGNRLLIMTSNFKVATCLYYQGKIYEAEKLIRTAINDAKLKGLSSIPRIGLLWTLLGEILREKGMLEDAERCVERGLLFSEPEKPCLGWNYIFKVALSYSKRDHEQANQAMHEAEMLNHEFQLPLFVLSALERWKVRLLAEKGEYKSALKILASSGINTESKVKGGYEWRHLVLARILLQQEKPDLETAGRILDEVEKLSKQGGYFKLLMETMLIKTIFLELSGAQERADELLSQTLAKGKNSGFFQVFCDSVKEIEPILQRLLKHSDKKPGHGFEGCKDFIIQIFSSSGIDIETAGESDTVNIDLPGVTRGNTSELIEELTTRELEVLALINDGLSNEAIAKELFLSLGTVKWHTTNIYGKLGVRRRTEAVAQARKLKLIS